MPLDLPASLLSGLYIPGALGVLLLGYFYIFWDKRKDDSANKDDGQVGLKLTLFALIMVGLSIALGGVSGLVHYLASATKAEGGTPLLKASIGHLVSGAVVIGAVMFLFLPRTNSKDYPQAERFMLGAITVIAGVTAFMALDGFVSALLKGDAAGPWAGEKSRNLATFIVNGGLMFVVLSRFGTLSGWTAPVRPQAPMMPPGGGFPPQGGYQQGGYQQGGYQQGGGYPPQGGMPPGGGYPPQGGGMPPGGGYPPQGGGGYQPR